MKFVFRTAISIFLSFFFNSTAYGTPSLAAIYCGELVNHALHGNGAIEDDAKAWKELEARLFERRPRTEVAREFADSFELCLANHSPNFREGEFILGGWEHLSRTLSEVKVRKPEAVVESAEVTSVALDGYGRIAVLGGSQTSEGQTSAASGVNARQGRYRKLWSGFLAKIQGRGVPRLAQR